MQTVLLGVFVETEGFLVEHAAARENGGSVHAQLVDQVLPPDAQVLVLDFALLLLLESVADLPGVQRDWKRDRGLLELPGVVRDVQLAAVLAGLAGLRVACAFHLERLLVALEPPDGRFASFVFVLVSSPAHVVTHGPISDVDYFGVVFPCEFFFDIVCHIEVLLVHREC